MKKTYEQLEKENEALKEAIRLLVDATEDKNGQFRAWHQNLKHVTQSAKLLLVEHSYEKQLLTLQNNKD